MSKISEVLVESVLAKPDYKDAVCEVLKEHDSEADYEECYKGFCPECGEYIKIDESMIGEDGCAECPNCEEEIDVDDIEDEFEGNCPECGKILNLIVMKLTTIIVFIAMNAVKNSILRILSLKIMVTRLRYYVF